MKDIADFVGKEVILGVRFSLLQLVDWSRETGRVKTFGLAMGAAHDLSVSIRSRAL
jgi:hypothetical protein